MSQIPPHAGDWLYVKFKGQPRLAIERCRHEHITDGIGEFDRDWKPIIVEARIKIDLCETHHVRQHDSKIAVTLYPLGQRGR
jgi:hypothetical protein